MNERKEAVLLGYETDEVIRILRAIWAKDMLYRLCIFHCYSGVRISSAKGLTFEMFKEVEGVPEMVSVQVKGKAGRNYKAFIPERVFEFLKENYSIRKYDAPTYFEPQDLKSEIFGSNKETLTSFEDYYRKTLNRILKEI